MSKETITIFHDLTDGNTWTENIHLIFQPNIVRVKTVAYSSVDATPIDAVFALKVDFIPQPEILALFTATNSISTPDVTFLCTSPMLGNVNFSAFDLTSSQALTNQTGVIAIQLQFEEIKKLPPQSSTESYVPIGKGLLVKIQPEEKVPVDQKIQMI